MPQIAITCSDSVLEGDDMGFNDNSINSILELVEQNKTSLTTIILSRNNFTQVGTIRLLNELGKYTNLTTINLSHNNLENLNTLCTPLAHLKNFNLSNTHLELKDIKKLTQLLPKTIITISNASHANFDQHQAQSLVQKHNQQVKQFYNAPLQKSTLFKTSLPRAADPKTESLNHLQNA